MSEKINLKWKVFWKLSVIDYLYCKDRWYRKCKCGCWNICFFNQQQLRSWKIKDCWCSKNIIWKIFWKLTVIREIDKLWKNVRYRCVCNCWWECIINRNNLITWTTKSCWCIRKLKPNSLHHWKYWTKIYRAWTWMKNRCNNKKDVSYKLYWWRWIKCLRNSFDEFKYDMEKWCVDWYSLDRIDVNWNYCKENCRWATPKEQANNRRTNRYITLNWTTKTMIQWEEYLWISRWTIYERLKKWLSYEESLISKKYKWSN